ncbi:MAG TPA: bile acid:sodium symporter [Nitrosospira sp.]|nr:bile acid:sodium symporter [Nitrosospira sp.]
MELSLDQIVGLALKLCILSSIFGLGLKASWADAASLLYRPELLMRSLFAMYVLTPLTAMLLVLAFPAPQAVEIAVLLMAISAGAPLLPKKLLKLGVNPPYIYSLSIIASLLAIVSVPISLAIVAAFVHRSASIAATEVAYAIATVFLAPLLAGMVVRRLWPALAERISDQIIGTANIILLGLILFIGATNLSAIFGAVDLSGFALIVVMTFAALAIGHVLGGPDSNDRTALAVACASRFPALVLLIASLNYPAAKPLPVVAAYLLFSNLAAIPYLRWRMSGRKA